MNTLLSQNWVECLGWTLVHFIWQGFFIAALLAIVLRLLRGAASNQRYLAGCLALVLMAIAPIVTLRVVAGRYAAEPVPAVAPLVAATPAERPLLIPSSDSRIVVRATQSIHSRNFAEKVERFFPWLVFGWSLGVLALSCRLLGGWLQVERMRRHGVSALTEEWHQKMKLLSERLGIHRPVRLLQSALVEVPTVIGWLRPMILLPASCIVGLSPAQLESILAHELAHIRRHDYLVNLVQSVVETVLFYHPAVWWVSRRVREERENCCDDLAVEVSGDRAVYARALATLETLRLASAPLALGASGSPLLPRIRRLAGQSSSKSTDRPAWPLAGIIVLFLLIAALAIELRGNRALADENENRTTNAPAGGALSDQTTRLRAATLAQEAKLLFEAGKLNEADFKFTLVKQMDPTNAVANHYLAAIKQKRESDSIDVVHESRLDAPPKVGTRLNPIVKPGKPPKIVAKLNSIEVDSIHFDHVPLPQVVRQVSELAKSLDPQHEGINFFLEPSIQNSSDAVPIDPATGLPERTVWVDTPNMSVTIDPPLHHLRLADVLDAIVRCADHPLRYRVLDYAVAFSPEQPGAFKNRAFHVDPNTFLQGLQGTIGNPAGSTNGGPSASAATKQSGINAEVAQAQIRRLFEQAGVDLSTNNPANAGKMFAWNDRRFILFVRSTPRDLDLIDQAIQALNYSPKPEVNIKVKFLSIQDLDSNTARRQKLEQILPMLQALEKPTMVAPSPRSVITVLTNGSSCKTNISFVTDAIVSATNGVLSEEQYAKAIEMLEHMDGVDELNAPEVTTESGRQAQVQAVEMKTIVTISDRFRNAQGKLENHYQTVNMPCGPITDLIPRVSQDGKNVDLKVVASVTEFLGYGLPGHSLVPEKLYNKPVADDQTYPNIRVSQLITDSTVQDGETLVLAGLELDKIKDQTILRADLPAVAKLQSSRRKALLVFITPTMINPDGTRFHPEKVASDEKHPTSL